MPLPNYWTQRIETILDDSYRNLERMSTRAPGRPRSEHARQAVLDAAATLVGRQGYAATTMEGIAKQAGVSKQTVYRWWPSPAAILLEVLNGGAAAIAPLEESGDFERDLRVFVHRSVLGARGKVGRLLTALMAQAQHDPVFAEPFRAEFLAARRAVLHTLLDHARSRGDLKPGTTDHDLGFVAELFFGTLWYRLLAASGPVNTRFADDLADTLLTLVGRGGS